MDDSLLEQLLNEDESASLDFKRDQYPFGGASDEVKAELLKDILAFANAWRRDTAYILTGVEDVKGGRSRPLGVTHHLEDHQLQQFVNGKTNRAMTLRYVAYPFQDVQVGVIEIPVQRRPIYLRKRFGGLVEDVVYLRRGSSTAIASPAEVADMGAANDAVRRPSPVLKLNWGQQRSRKLGAIFQFSVEVLEPRLTVETAMGLFGAGNPALVAEFIAYTFESALVRPIHLVVHNPGEVAVQRATLSARIAKGGGLRLSDCELRQPATYVYVDPALLRLKSAVPRAEPEVNDYDDHWTLNLPFGTVLPGQTVWSDSPIYLGSDKPGRFDFLMHFMAENLPSPLEVGLTVEVTTATRPMEKRDIEERDEDDALDKNRL